MENHEWYILNFLGGVIECNVGNQNEVRDGSL